MTIIVEVRNVYGNERIYPVCSTAHLLKKLTRQTTFDRSHLEAIKALGYKIEVKTVSL